LTVAKRSAVTGLWKDTHETAYYVCDIVPSAKEAARAIREHWGIENRSHYVRDGSFAEDASRIRKKPGVFARIRSFAANICASIVPGLPRAVGRDFVGPVEQLRVNAVAQD
jgi:predicted transposase YbfD/YdcC